MGRIQIFGEHLREKLRAGVPEEELLRWVRAQYLESYRNGVRAGGSRGGERGRRSARRDGER